jgi:serine/threonine-protein kinase
MDAAENVLRAGDKLDRYELLCPIASGGMATVWLARLRGKRGFEKLFAIKTIRTELVEDARFQEMFLDEARIASGVQHPNVAQIIDLGEANDVLFIVMEWVDGDSLAKVRKLAMRRATDLPVGVALRVLADAGAGLHAAHELRDSRGQPLGIVHRDVSPQNLLVSTAGSVKVIDFGIAKSQNRSQGETGTGVVKGKIQYMAPEQVKKGRTVDRRTDVWALGVCLHELVAGRPPYGGDDDVEVIRKLLHDEPPQLAEGLPEPVARILARSIAMDPDDRFPTAAGLQRALESAMKELGEPTTSDDVGGFLRATFPELEERRRRLVTQAIEAAQERRSQPTLGTAAAGEPNADEVAFAPTVISDETSAPRTKDEARAIALTKRKTSATTPLPARVAEPRPLFPHADVELHPPRRSSGLTLLVVFAIVAGGLAFGARWMGLWGGRGEASVPNSVPAPSAVAAPESNPPAAVLPVAVPDLPVDPSSAPAAPRPRERLAEPVDPRPGAALDAGTVATASDAQALELEAAAAAAQPSAAPPAADDDPNNPYN